METTKDVNAPVSEDFVIHDDLLLTDKDVFGDDMEHEYEAKCYDGYAIATRVSDDFENEPKVLRLEYPLRKDVLKNKKKANAILEFCGLYDLEIKDINYSDIMMYAGEIKEIIER